MNSEIIKEAKKEVTESGRRCLENLLELQKAIDTAEKKKLFYSDFMNPFLLKYRQRKREELIKLAEITSFILFAEFLLDGNVSDYFIQSKIVSTKEQINDACLNVEHILNRFTDIEWYYETQNK